MIRHVVFGSDLKIMKYIILVISQPFSNVFPIYSIIILHSRIHSHNFLPDSFPKFSHDFIIFLFFRTVSVALNLKQQNKVRKKFCLINFFSFFIITRLRHFCAPKLMPKLIIKHVESWSFGKVYHIFSCGFLRNKMKVCVHFVQYVDVVVLLGL